MFEGQVDSAKRIILLYDDVERHYHVITNISGAMARKYACKGCSKSCRRDVTHVCDQTCSDCMTSPPCSVSHVRIPCTVCNRHFRSRTRYVNHKQRISNKKFVCERKGCHATCRWIVTHEKHECNNRICDKRKQNKEIGHLCYVRPLKYALPPAGDKVLYVFYDFETTQITGYTDEAKLHVPNLVCLQQFCSRCEDEEDGGCVLCGNMKYSFWDDSVEHMLLISNRAMPLGQ
jgi:hypothetical protein